MNITELSVRRPSAIIVGIIFIVGLGVLGYVNLGADLFPSVNTPIISIRSTYMGAGAEQIDQDVVKPIEDAVSGVNGIDIIRSTSGEGYGYTILQFHLDTDINAAVIDVQKAIDGIAATLPAEATRPVMQKFDINSQPILILSVSGSLEPDELYNQADRIRLAVESMPGVGAVSLQGGQKRQLRIVLDRTALQYYSVSTNALLGTLKADNLSVPEGEIDQPGRQLTVRLTGELADLEDVRNLRIPTLVGSSVRLADLGQISLDYPDATETVRMDGSSSIGIFVRKQSDANVVTTADGVKQALAGLQSTLPPGVTVKVASDATLFVNSSLAETRLNLLESILTTSLVLFLFLRQWRSSLIVLIAIPISLIGTFFAMYALHYTLNIVSLMALGLCIGILVDDSIVILENVDRHIHLGQDPMRAAVDGRKEIGLAAVAITLCDVVVFAPIAFLQDIVGQFFKEFGLTVVCATLLSLLVSFTVTPMMASRMLAGRRGKRSQRIEPPEGSAEERTKGFGGFFDRTIKGSYRQVLLWALRNRWKVVFGIGILVVASLALLPLGVIQSEFMPGFDQSKLVVDLDLGAGAGYPQTDQKVRIVEKYLLGLPEVTDTFATIGSDLSSSVAEIVVKLKDKGQRRKSQT
ncbi:MAG TPA: efflux RND transporter permease subunit, partial [Spirochaetia bacterium]|nr:efflux RND transporter permease subunit [Spirochaetia bacterium]